MKTEFTHDGLMISAQDLSAISPESEDHDRMFHHDGSSSISMVGGSSTSQRGYYVWDSEEKAWYALFHNADKLDGKESGAFVHRDGSLSMQGDLDVDHFGLVDADFIQSGVGKLSLNENHVRLSALSGGADVRINDSDGLLLLNASEGGDVSVPNGTLSEQGDRVATRMWTNNNADVANADYADEANTLDGYDESAFLHAAGDQLEGTLDLGLNNVEDGSDVLWNAANSEVPQGSLGGPASSLNAYPLGSGDLAEDYAVTSRFPLPAGDLAEDYVLTSRLPLPAGDLAEDYALTSRFPIPNSDIANSSVTVNAGNQLTGGGSVGLGGSITVNVDENALDADTLDGEHASAFADAGHSHNQLHDKYTSSEAISAVNAETILSVDISGDADTLDGEHASAFADSGHTHDGRYYTESEADSNFASSGHLHDGRYIQDTGEVTNTLAANRGILVARGSTGLTANNSIESVGTDDYIGIDTTSGANGGVLLGYYNAPEVRVGNGNLSDFVWNGDTVATRPWVNANADVPNADYADDADMVDGEHASSFANSGHTHDSRYYNEGQDLTGTSRVGGSGLFFDFDNSSSWIELVDGGGTRSDLVTGDVYINDLNGGTWLADDAVTGGYDIQKNGSDSNGVINFKT